MRQWHRQLGRGPEAEERAATGGVDEAEAVTALSMPGDVDLALSEGEFVLHASAGSIHSVAVTSLGHLLAWGDNRHAQAGVDAEVHHEVSPGEPGTEEGVAGTPPGPQPPPPQDSHIGAEPPAKSAPVPPGEGAATSESAMAAVAPGDGGAIGPQVAAQEEEPQGGKRDARGGGAQALGAG